MGVRDVSSLLHAERVQVLSWMMGIRCGVHDAALTVLELGAIFHDIGKLAIPDAVLLKPSKLDEAEWAIIRKHPEMGANIVRATHLDGAPPVAEAILYHHEHFDGSGYPAGLAGEAIPLASRIISIADSYDAMAVTRAYHPCPRNHAEIMQVMRAEVGIKHDPLLFGYFSEIIENSGLRQQAVEALRQAAGE